MRAVVISEGKTCNSTSLYLVLYGRLQLLREDTTSPSAHLDPAVLMCFTLQATAGRGTAGGWCRQWSGYCGACRCACVLTPADQNMLNAPMP